MNGMLYVRGNRQDYDHWAALGNTGWSYNETLPYFIKSENNLDPQFAADTMYHGTGGFQSVQTLSYEDINVRALIAAFRETGYRELDFNGADQEGVMRTQTTTINGERQSSNSAFLAPIRRVRPNLGIVTNATVTKILIDGMKRANGVQYVLEEDRNTTLTVMASKEVIISAGAINSAQILSLSGVGPREFLEPLGVPVIQDECRL
jgi:choline dehydrogenase-like flavoprotein